ncbi:tetratricopeptide repeat protein [Oceanicoccus sp. KOV_DT_Chl]|uniref:tetratricopeptide repeat protein n=1 Tax=Oceanicoccus sp. KOV_DT_Chl TaxID=1904639 RepID=UPI000C7C7FDC|nr:tetratricopeptide repeat protein [Oceanicoccus sp. KOV_DT_Chl]
MRWSPFLMLPLTGVVLLASSCSWIGQDEQEPPAELTLSALPTASLPIQGEPIASKSLAEVHALYRDALTADQHPVSQFQLKRRLAALEMMRGERRLFDGEPSEALFAETVSVYQELLAADIEPQSRDQLLYQLAKAHAMGGQLDESIDALSQLSSDHQQSALFVESEFRRAESFFSAGLYAEAGASYQKVVDAGVESAYYHNALYMVGWSRFKQNQYRLATDAFIATLDALAASSNNFYDLSKGDKELVKDCYRVLSVTFSYREGASSLNDIEGGLQAHHYLPDLYDALAMLYLSQERFQDSADTYKAFAATYPQADQSHEFFVRAIAMVERAGFAEEVLRDKRQYTQQFAVGSEYWQNHSAAVREKIAEHLQVFIPQLAKFYHARAQQLQKALTTAPVKKQDELRQEMLASYQQAADDYQQYIDSFPGDERLPEFHFLLAEARYDSGQYADAIIHYDIVAYDYPADKNAMEAGYAGILAYGRIIDTADEKALFAGAWKERRIASELRYARQFNQDPRVPDLVLHAAESLSVMKFDLAAIAAAEFLLPQEQNLALEQRRSVWWLIAQSSYRQQDYAYAEPAYQQAIQTLPAKDKRIQEWTELLAASIYKQGEAALVAGNNLQASEQFLRVIDVAPASSVRVTAQYDAAEQLLALEQWTQAIGLLKDFEQRFPNNRLVPAIPAKLVLAYEQTEDWQAAADEIMLMFAKTTDVEQQAELLFLAASYFERADNRAEAIVHYRQYAHNYPQYFATRLEAMNKMDSLYQQTGEPDKRRFWLRKIIATDAQAGSQRNDRSRHLAASASAVLADDAYQDFLAIKLKLPMKKSFKKKKQAMDKVVKAYTKTNDYGIEAFSTLAVYRLAEVYAQLSRDLMASERPAKLDELEREQYDVLLEEQAFPFEEKAIAIHEGNAQRSWDGVYNASVKKSFSALSVLLPARYGKQEQRVEWHEGIH